MSNFSFSKIDIQLSLAQKYSQSDTYYYTKSLNEFIDNARTSQVINFHYITNCEEECEYLRRTYHVNDIATKLGLLTEYYKFHNKIPRYFMTFICDIMSNYHDKKRRIEYFRIKRMIENENQQNPNQPQKKIIGEEPEQNTTQRSGQQYSNILNEITDVSRTIDKIQMKLQSIKLNVGELQLMPSNREQEQLDKFIKFVTEKKSSKHINILKTPHSVQLKLPIGLSQKTVRQVLQRKMIAQQSTQISTQQTINLNKSNKQLSLYQQPSQIQSSPRTNIRSIQKQSKDNIFGSFTQRVGKESTLSKLLSPLQIQVFSPNSQIQNKCKTSVSISKQFKITETVKSSIRFHQHTRSDLKLFKRY